ncbi:MAG: Trm112 family protein [Kofleriaceae bacterium]|nr:Trm112 family protein [Kofleriaceae bacterium]MCL4227985.1 hypothetical protein [Myxococcales bacterium]
MTLSPDLLAALVCPESRQPLLYFAGGEAGDQPDQAFLLCEASGLRYRIDGGVPVLLVEEAERLEARELERLVARARVLGLAPGNR